MAGQIPFNLIVALDWGELGKAGDQGVYECTMDKGTWVVRSKQSLPLTALVDATIVNIWRSDEGQLFVACNAPMAGDVDPGHTQAPVMKDPALEGLIEESLEAFRTMTVKMEGLQTHIDGGDSEDDAPDETETETEEDDPAEDDPEEDDPDEDDPEEDDIDETDDDEPDDDETDEDDPDETEKSDSDDATTGERNTSPGMKVLNRPDQTPSY